jgi:hypothetical protein
MFNIEYYGMSGSLIGTDENVEFEDIGARLAKFAQVAQDGDTIRLVELERPELFTTPAFSE